MCEQTGRERDRGKPEPLPRVHCWDPLGVGDIGQEEGGLWESPS